VNFSDVVWAPYICHFYKTFGGTKIFNWYFQFAEEILPFTDFTNLYHYVGLDT